jgi:hypothetical protein
MAGMWKTFERCVKCSHTQWVDHFDSEESDGSPCPHTCPKCGGDWTSCDPSLSDKKLGDLHKCGRCQKNSLGGQSASVTNAPAGIYDSWCYDCILAVQAGASPVLHGISIDKEGFVIRIGHKGDRRTVSRKGGRNRKNLGDPGCARVGPGCALIVIGVLTSPFLIGIPVLVLGIVLVTRAKKRQKANSTTVAEPEHPASAPQTIQSKGHPSFGRPNLAPGPQMGNVHLPSPLGKEEGEAMRRDSAVVDQLRSEWNGYLSRLGDTETIGAESHQNEGILGTSKFTIVDSRPELDRLLERDALSGQSIGTVFDSLATELVRIGRGTPRFTAEPDQKTPAYDSECRHKRAREIGQLLDAAGGRDLRVAAACRVRVSGGSMRDLCDCWEGIGKW